MLASMIALRLPESFTGACSGEEGGVLGKWWSSMMEEISCSSDVSEFVFGIFKSLGDLMVDERSRCCRFAQ